MEIIELIPTDGQTKSNNTKESKQLYSKHTQHALPSFDQNGSNNE